MKIYCYKEEFVVAKWSEAKEDFANFYISNSFGIRDEKSIEETIFQFSKQAGLFYRESNCEYLPDWTVVGFMKETKIDFIDFDN